MMRRKGLVSAALATLLALTMTACGGDSSTPTNDEGSGSDAGGTPEYTIKVGHTLQEDTPAHKAWLLFEEQVEANSEGRIAVELYPNSSLGTERVMFEACQMGTLEVAYGTTSVLANFDKNMEVLDLPFLFEDEATARAAITGELGTAAAANLGDIGLINLTYMENSIHMSSFTHLGASPTPMAFTELFTALQQGTVDGEENPLFLIQTSRFEEVQDYLSLTGHFYTAGIATINKAFFESLPEDLQTVVTEAADAAREEEYRLCDEQNATALEYLKTEMEVNEISPENRQLFVDATAPVYDEVRTEIGDELVDMALAAQAG